MNVYASHDIAGDGCAVSTSVFLLWDRDQPFAERPFRARSMVGGVNLATSHHRTQEEAAKHADKMHAAYLEVHAEAS